MRSWRVLFLFIVVCDDREIVWCLWWKCISPSRISSGWGVWFFFCEWLTTQSSAWWQMCCWDLITDSSHPSDIFSRGCWILFFWFHLLWFTFLNVLIVLFDQTNFLSVRLSWGNLLLLVLHLLSRDISKRFWGSGPSSAVYQNPAQLLNVNSSAVDLWK